MARRGLDIELCTRCAVFLLRCHQPQIVSTQSLLSEMLALKSILSTSISDYRSLVGTNIAALKYSQRILDERKENGLMSSSDLEQAAAAAVALAPKKGKGKKKAKHT